MRKFIANAFGRVWRKKVAPRCGEGLPLEAAFTDAFCRQIVEHSPDCIKLLDREGHLLWMNPHGLRLMDLCDIAPLVGSPWVELWGGGEAHGAARTALETARAGGIGRLTGPCPTATGRMKWWNVVVVPVSGPDGHLLSISRDVTDLGRALDEQNALATAERAAREEADRARVAKDDLLAVLSHEMRTPVNAILGWAVLLQSQAKDAATVDMARQIERIAAHELQLVSDVIDQHRGKPQPSIPLEPVSVAAILRDVIEEVAPITAAKRLHVSCEIPDDPAFIRGDTRRLRQVFLNLLSNSVKFTPAGGHLAVSLHLHDGRVTVAVRDTGVGIDRAFLARVFDRFTQEDVADVRRHGGLGLGLSIAHGFVALHDGAITADSAGRNTGATFTVDFPALTPGAPGTSAGERLPLSAAPRLEGIRVGLVMRDDDACDAVGGALRRLGANVLTSTSQTSFPEDIDVLVADVDVQLAGHATHLAGDRAMGPTFKSIALTARSEQARARALALGFDVVSSKPVVPRALALEIVALHARGVH